MSDLATRRRPAEWSKVAFGDVIDVVNDYWDRDTKTPERLVAGEHINEGDMKVRRWGMTDDDLIPPTFNRRFQPGDALLHSRNIKKVAQPDFGGITGEKLFILRSKDESVLLQDLIPWLVEADVFRGYAESRWAGSTNKFLNKAPLVEYEFALPPLKEQQRIVELLRAANRQTDSMRVLENNLERVIAATLQSEFAVERDRAPLSEWCRNLITYGIVQAGPDAPGGIPYIRVSDMTAGPTLRLDGMLRTTKAIAEKYKRSEVAAGDIVVALRGPVGLPMVVPTELDGANLTQGTARVSVTKSHCRDYVLWALRSPATRRQYMRYAKGSTFSEISLDALRKIKLPLRSLHEQQIVADRLNALAARQSVLANRLESSELLARRCLEQSLGGEA